jgi:hypothetical protein
MKRTRVVSDDDDRVDEASTLRKKPRVNGAFTIVDDAIPSKFTSEARLKKILKVLNVVPVRYFAPLPSFFPSLLGGASPCPFFLI